MATAEELWREHAGELLRFATVLVGPDDASDVVSAAFGRASERVVVGAVDEPRAYLYRAVTNEAHDQRRRRARQWKRDLLMVSMPVPEEDPLFDVREAVASLSVRQRAVVFLRYWLDLSERDIAEVLGLSVGTVRRHVVRAEAHLRKALQ